MRRPGALRGNRGWERRGFASARDRCRNLLGRSPSVGGAFGSGLEHSCFKHNASSSILDRFGSEPERFGSTLDHWTKLVQFDKPFFSTARLRAAMPRLRAATAGLCARPLDKFTPIVAVRISIVEAFFSVVGELNYQAGRGIRPVRNVLTLGYRQPPLEGVANVRDGVTNPVPPWGRSLQLRHASAPE